LLQQQQEGPKSFSQNLSAKMNDELPRYRWNKKCATKNKIVTKQQKTKEITTKNSKPTEKEQQQEQLQKTKQSN
jgi:hypothetical protein